MTVSKISEIVENQKEYFASGKTKEIDFRIAMLKKLKTAILDHKDDVVDSVNRDFGTGEYDGYGRIVYVIDEINHFIKKLKKWNRPVRVKTHMTLFHGRSEYIYEPYGVSLIIGAWNAPYMVTFLPLIASIGAGNCSVVKPSEISPATSQVITRIIRSVFPPEFCAVVEGGVPETTALLEQKFDFICYTGSTNVGKIVYKAATEHLIPVLLELGGKSPCIVDESADIKLTARRICTAKLLNAGQVCTSPDYITVHKNVKEKLISELEKTIREFYPDSALNSEDYTQIINEKNFNRLTGLLESVQPEKVRFGGGQDRNKLKIEPTLIDNVNWDDLIMSDEIFGPLIPIIEYEDLDSVIDKITKREKPLALYIYSKNEENIKKIRKATSSGALGINVSVLHFLNKHLPFGGVGNSGIGKYRGRTGYETFSHQKAIFNKALFFESKLMSPPYGNKHKMLEMMLR